MATKKCVCVGKGWPLILLQSKGGPGNSDLAVCCWREEGRRIGDDDVDDSNKRWKKRREKRKGRKEKVRLSRELPSSSLNVQEENVPSCFSALLFIR